MPAQEPAWPDLALSCTRDEFAARYPFPFLFGRRAALRPVKPQRTEVREITAMVPMDLVERPGEGELLVLPVRKIQEAFPSMITIGRTNNNDVVVTNPQISKFHAFFRKVNDDWELADAGSRNGTTLKGAKLEAKKPVKVSYGDKLALGGLQFEFLDASGLWTALVAALDRWGD